MAGALENMDGLVDALGGVLCRKKPLHPQPFALDPRFAFANAITDRENPRIAQAQNEIDTRGKREHRKKSGQNAIAMRFDKSLKPVTRIFEVLNFLLRDDRPRLQVFLLARIGE